MMFVSAFRELISIISKHPGYFILSVIAYEAGVFGLERITAYYAPDDWVRKVPYQILMLAPDMVIQTLFQALIIFGVYQACYGESPRIGGAFTAIRNRLLRLVVAYTMVFVVSMIGTMFFIIPGVLIALRYAFLLPVILIEKRPLFESESISARVVDGWKMKVFSVYFVAMMLPMLMLFAVYVVFAASAAAPGEEPNFAMPYVDLGFVIGFGLLNLVCTGIVTLYYIMARWGTWDLAALEAEAPNEFSNEAI